MAGGFAAKTPGDDLVFDIHAHVSSADQARYPPAPLDGTIASDAYVDPVTVERLLADMAARGVTRAVVVQRAHVYGYDNRYTLDATAAHLDRLRALCIVNAEAANSGRTARELLRREGVRGLRLTSPAGRKDVDWFAGDQAREVWRESIEAGRTMRLHLYGWNRTMALAALETLLDELPQTKLVIDHLVGTEIEKGPPGYGIDEGLLRLADRGNVQLMFSAINQRRLDTVGAPAAPLIRRIVDLFGADRLLWGSDFGNTRMPYEDMIAWARDATSLLSPEERAQVLWKNAAQLYDL